MKPFEADLLNVTRASSIVWKPGSPDRSVEVEGEEGSGS